MKKLFFLLVLIGLCCNFAMSKEEITYPKPVVISFFAKNCDECEQMKTLHDGGKEAFGDKIDFVEIDFDSDDCDIIKLKNKYNIKTAPTTIFLNAQYRITKKNTGLINPKNYLKQITSILK